MLLLATKVWEQRKLGNLFNERKEKSTKGELLSVTLSNGVTKFSDLNKKNNSNIKSGNYKVVKKNDIPYNSMRMWQGASGVSSYDGIVSPAYTVLVPNRNSNSNFYAVLFKKKSILNLFTRFSQGLTSDTWNLKYPILKDIIVPFTNLEEQKRIFKIFNVINNLLALYDRKLKLLSQIKKYFLDNLFAKKEYPNLRFKGFTDAWEQRKLNEVATRVLRKNKNLISKRPLTISAQYGLIDQQAFFNKQVASSNLENYLLLEKGEFAYNKSYSDGFPYGTIKKLNLYDNGAVSTLYIAFKANADINSDFLENLFSSNKWNNEVYKIAAEGARNHGLLNISPDDFFNIKITISKDSQEQVFISKFLKVFDNLLALYENKQNYLTEIKNTLLNTMFI